MLILIIKFVCWIVLLAVEVFKIFKFLRLFLNFYEIVDLLVCVLIKGIWWIWEIFWRFLFVFEYLQLFFIIIIGCLLFFIKWLVVLSLWIVGICWLI